MVTYRYRAVRVDLRLDADESRLLARVMRVSGLAGAQVLRLALRELADRTREPISSHPPPSRPPDSDR